MAPRSLPLLAGVAVLVLSGVVHGLCTQRWQTSEALDTACARVPSVPLRAGAWTAAAVEVDPEPFEQARAAAYWVRRYTREGVAGSVTVILMCGRAGHMAVHTPDVCYRGAGYEMAAEPVRQNLKAGEFWTARFSLPGRTVIPGLRIFWSWSADGRWQAPSSPRWAFGGEPFLYKLYVVRDAADESVLNEFLGELLPVLEQSLFSGTASVG
jgi:hypothetical protein